jgi:hypothetical protein
MSVFFSAQSWVLAHVLDKSHCAGVDNYTLLVERHRVLHLVL